VRARIRLAGELQVETDQGLVRSADFPGRQGRLVFARLASNPFVPVSRDDLAAVVWPDTLPKSWERDLSAVVSKIRALLIGVGFDDPVASAFGCYQLKLGADVHIDVEAAKRFLEDAEAAYGRGDVLTAQAPADTAFNHTLRPLLPGEESDWVAARRAEWDELKVRAGSLLVEINRERGILPEARRVALQLVDLDPYREQTHAALMRVLLASGDRAAALKTYDAARTRFIDEIGVPPGALLEAAYQEALAADPDLVPAAGAMPRGTVALLFTDLVGSVALGERLGDAGDDEMRRDHFGLLRECITAHDGHEVKNLGDGLMVVFESSGDAVDAAVAIQRRVRARNAAADVPIAIRIGVHVGEPSIEDGDYFGRPVAVARRLCDAATGGEILVSDLVRGLSRVPELFCGREEVTLKGMTDPTCTWRVQADFPV
jgi:class 3 adenylate cyclase